MLLGMAMALVALIVVGVVAVPFQASGAPAQTTTAVTPVGSLTPMFTPAAAVPASRNANGLPGFGHRPIEPYAGPTVTASGANKGPEAVSNRDLYRKIPTTI